MLAVCYADFILTGSVMNIHKVRFVVKLLLRCGLRSLLRRDIDDSAFFGSNFRRKWLMQIATFRTACLPNLFTMTIRSAANEVLHEDDKHQTWLQSWKNIAF